MMESLVKRNKSLFFLVLLTVLISSRGYGEDLCENVHRKPVFDGQQVKQAELVHYMVVLCGLKAPNPDGKSPGDYYEEEVQLLVDYGFPPALAEVEPNRLVTRRYFASMLFQVAVDCNEEFAEKYGHLTDETDQINALIEADCLYSKEGRIYRKEILSVLCSKSELLSRPKPEPVMDLTPVSIIDAAIESGSLIESVASPI